MFNTLKKIESANLGMIWLFIQALESLWNCYQGNTPGFGIRIFAVAALVIFAVVICKFIIPWAAVLAVNYNPGISTHAVSIFKWIANSWIIKGCIRACRRVCRAGG